MDQQNKSSIGGIIGTIIIIALIILGGLYFWGKRIEETKLKEQLVAEEPQQEVVIDEATSIKMTAQGDDLDSLEADLNATNLDNLSSELN